MINKNQTESVESKIQKLRELEHKTAILTAEIIRMGGDHRRPVIVHNSSQVGNSPRPTEFQLENELENEFHL